MAATPEAGGDRSRSSRHDEIHGGLRLRLRPVAGTGFSERGTVRKTLESVDRVVSVLQRLESDEPLTLAEVARRTGLSEPTVLRYLTSLSAHGLIERTATGRYRLGWELFRLGQQALTSRFPRDLALPVMEELRERFNETVNFGLRQGDELVVVEVLQSKRALKPVNEVGQRDPWHASALGKAILAHMPQADRTLLLDRVGCPALTARTIVDRAELERDLDETSTRGYSVDRHEVEDDLTCVAAAVLTRGGAPSFAVSVSFPTHRVQPQLLDQAGAAVRAAADELRLRLGHAES